MCSFKCIRGLVSENALTVNVVTSPKNSWDLQKSTFILLFDHSEPNWVTESYFSSDLRLQDCLLKGWAQTTSILVVIERICHYQLKCNYLKIHQFFAAFFWFFLESTLNFQCSEKNNEPDRSSISEFTVFKRCVDLNV